MAKAETDARRQQGGSATEDAPWWKKLGWMAAIWGMSVGALGIVAYLIRWWLAS